MMDTSVKVLTTALPRRKHRSIYYIILTDDVTHRCRVKTRKKQKYKYRNKVYLTETSRRLRAVVAGNPVGNYVRPFP